ncbi:hypothetical protein, conserved [Angomonas deanei]|uniref:Uncharacterized protein n=1 Tax=Angomonas deanei TaxID=59799 RepID=A0A7G2CFI7_9TRYP|nr:hypothetical protein, conserved [Angomonas deanei]
MGVNHAYHTLVNGSDGVLKGILKGCAEQNALGALAAHGLSYRLVDRVYIAASCMPGKTPRATNTPIVNAKTVPFPCPECWSKFVQISHVRRDSGAAPLEVFVRCLPEEEHIVRIAGKARECARLQPTIRVTLVLDDGIYGDRQV